jgi:ubiquinone/menaquinone biosynthesis C-methylase UbiE
LKDKNIVKERYDELGGALYDIRYTEEQQAKYRLILNELNQPDLILDNGCGTGLILPMLEYTVVGLELSSVLVEKARERVKKHHHLIQGDSEFLPLRECVFDAVISVTVIQNLSNPETLVSESTRVSKPSSTIIISSIKRAFSKEEITRIVKSDELSINKIFTSENVNDWITVLTRNQ